VRQRFKNTEAKPIEATYCFPLEEGSAVCGFEVKVGDRLIQGRVEEREKAFEKYDEAMAEGDGAFLLDQEKPNIFIASIGNLMPG
jgi:Ca-activated chloride channel family protein